MGRVSFPSPGLLPAAVLYSGRKIRPAKNCPAPDLPIGLGAVGQAQEVVNAGLIKARQGDQSAAGDIERAAFVTGIGGLRDVKQFRQTPLRQIPVLPQISQTLIHIRSILPAFFLAVF